ncbi:unnamed protein product [Calicophoron daubneyi]|uniref:MITD1 C-terminal phospholipase D-like domain-containing protein n=1 Tax=Calicophoron daubneyi TaxID=300641 RepID=A0AAV2TBN8_CALDB
MPLLAFWFEQLNLKSRTNSLRVLFAIKKKPQEQIKKFKILRDDLQAQSVTFEWDFSDTLHDREIRFDNGWIVKIGRGLDYVRRSEHKFCGLGVHDYDFRPCAATTVDIFHRSSLRIEK